MSLEQGPSELTSIGMDSTTHPYSYARGRRRRDRTRWQRRGRSADRFNEYASHPMGSVTSACFGDAPSGSPRDVPEHRHHREMDERDYTESGPHSHRQEGGHHAAQTGRRRRQGRGNGNRNRRFDEGRDNLTSDHHHRDQQPHGNQADAHNRRQRRDRSRDRSAPRRSQQRPKKLSVPDNWADVPKIGSRVGDSPFIAMRVPLDAKFTRLIKTEADQWTPEMFLQARSDSGHDIQLLIDLTNTTKYYDGELEFRDSSVKYVKLPIEGFKHPPRASEVDAFIRIVDDFVSSAPGSLVAVHCTHGLNRTGYLIVAYLVLRQRMTVRQALKTFSDARPPGLIKHMYVEDLYRRYAPSDDCVLPVLPDWAVAKYAGRQ